MSALEKQLHDEIKASRSYLNSLMAQEQELGEELPSVQNLTEFVEAAEKCFWVGDYLTAHVNLLQVARLQGQHAFLNLNQDIVTKSSRMLSNKGNTGGGKLTERQKKNIRLSSETQKKTSPEIWGE